jgi:hypothetical protein
MRIEVRPTPASMKHCRPHFLSPSCLADRAEAERADLINSKLEQAEQEWAKTQAAKGRGSRLTSKDRGNVTRGGNVTRLYQVTKFTSLFHLHSPVHTGLQFLH